jgi:hypothetical protein
MPALAIADPQTDNEIGHIGINLSSSKLKRCSIDY